jgi:hypothetical protein
VAAHGHPRLSAQEHTRLWDRFQRAWAQLRRYYEPGTWAGDVNRFVNALDDLPVPDAWPGCWESLDRWRVAAALARHTHFLSSGFEDPWVARCHRHLVSRYGPVEVERLLREELFPVALMLAATDMTRRRPLRLGKTPVKDAANRAGAFSPEHLPVPDAYTWLRQEAHRVAAELVLDRGDTQKPPRPRLGYVDASRGLDDFLAEVEDLLPHLVPEPTADRPLRPDHDLVRAMSAEGHTAAEIGQILGLSAGAVRALRHRIRQKP